jgi:hypothetical protein
VLLVLDGTNGQNAISQAEQFKKSVKCTGIILTKLDGTAKGGAIFSIKQKLDLASKVYRGWGKNWTTCGNRSIRKLTSRPCSHENREGAFLSHPISRLDIRTPLRLLFFNTRVAVNMRPKSVSS